jgi:hypothetical protein
MNIKHLVAFILMAGFIVFFGTIPLWAQCRTYTEDADFDEGLFLNLNHDPNHDQLQIDSVTTTFPFIWIALSGRGTIVKVDVNTGAVLGEYWSAPDGRGRNPSRTTVDLNGNVWAGNRDEISGEKGSAIHIGLVAGGTRVNADGSPNPSGDYLKPPFLICNCVDKDVDGLIKTSRGLGDVRTWLNPGGVDDNGGVSSADDECMLHYVRVNGRNTRSVAVDANNNPWIGGYNFSDEFDQDLVDGATGAILQSISPGCGGYGGLIDGNGVLWSADLSFNRLLRYDPSTNTTTCIPLGTQSYGLGIDNNGNIWNSTWSNNSVHKISPAGAILATYPLPSGCHRGVAVTPADNNVWIANSCGNHVNRLDNNGNLLATIPVGSTPTGVAVDANGKVWVTNYDSHNAMRIDPATNTVDLTVPFGSGAYPYNYSDMTGIVSRSQTAPQGTWTVGYDGGAIGRNWGKICWNNDPCDQPPGTSITARARSSEDQVTWSPWEDVGNCVDLTVPDGRYLQVEMKLIPNDDGESPILCDVTICTGVQFVNLDIKPQSCPNPFNMGSKGVLPVAILGTEDFDVMTIDPATVRLEGVAPLRWNFEDVSTPVGPDADTCECTTLGADGYMDMTLKFDHQAIAAALGPVQDREVRVLTLTGMTYDSRHIMGKDCVIILKKGKAKLSDDETIAGFSLGDAYPNPFNPETEISFSIPEKAQVSLSIYNILGEKVKVLVNGEMSAGTHTISWKGTDEAGNPVASGIYFYKLSAGDLTATKKMVLTK